VPTTSLKALLAVALRGTQRHSLVLVVGRYRVAVEDA
jgi:hypothetical protein